MSNLNRREGENLVQYKVRICKLRDNGQLDWNEVAHLINTEFDKNCSKDTYRKWWEVYKECEDFIVSENISEDKFLQEIEKQKFNLELERKKKQATTVEYNKVIREEARLQLLMEEIKKSIERVEPPKFQALPIPTGKRGAFLGISDIHYGKRFESVNNIYSEKIVKERLDLLLSKTVDAVRKEGLDHLHIINNGDNVEGMCLRAGQLTALESGFTDQVISFRRMMAEWLNQLSEYVEITYHHVQSANHTELRPLGTKAGQFVKEDMERIISSYIHDLLEKNERITVPEYDRDYIRFNLCGHNIYAKHGHQIKNIGDSIKDLSILHREFIDMLVLGHYHHLTEITAYESEVGNCDVVVLPSIMGSDEYSDSILTGSKAGARMYILQEGSGDKDIKDFILN